MHYGKFIIIVLDSLGIGAMDDAAQVRPQDIEANTLKHLLERGKNIAFDTLIELGLINALGEEINGYKKNPKAVFGASNLAHFGGDTYFGHQEILGTKPLKPVLNRFADFIDIIEADLQKAGYTTARVASASDSDGKDKGQNSSSLSLLSVNNAAFIGDNLETDPGQAINVTGSFDLIDFEGIKKIGSIVRKRVGVSRVIAFGGKNVSFDNLIAAIRQKNGYIGIDAPLSGVYREGYQVIHIGYGVDTAVQLPNVLYQKGITSYLYGKVADIVENPNGKLSPGVDTAAVFDEMLKDLKEIKEGFFFLNVQETDLAGHLQDIDYYVDRLNTADLKIREVIKTMGAADILIIMADHGNDPTINSKHTREKVPILIYKRGLESKNIGLRQTLSDAGATAANFFGAKLSYGISFLDYLI
jgi:phosphopentomutase